MAHASTEGTRWAYWAPYAGTDSRRTRSASWRHLHSGRLARAAAGIAEILSRRGSLS